MADKTKRKVFIWKSLRISFWTMVILGIISFFNPDPYSTSVFWAITGLLFMAVTIFTFITSIIHLTKHKEKSLAVTALVISSIFLLLFLTGLIIGLLYPTPI